MFGGHLLHNWECVMFPESADMSGGCMFSAKTSDFTQQFVYDPIFFVETCHLLWPHRLNAHSRWPSSTDCRV